MALREDTGATKITLRCKATKASHHGIILEHSRFRLHADRDISLIARKFKYSSAFFLHVKYSRFAKLCIRLPSDKVLIRK